MPVARAYSEWVARSSSRARSKARTKVKGAADSPAATAAQSRVVKPITSTASSSAGSEARMPTRLRTANASERGNLAATKPNSAPAISATMVAGKALRTVALSACSVSLSMSRPNMSVPSRKSADGAASSGPMPVALAGALARKSDRLTATAISPRPIHPAILSTACSDAVRAWLVTAMVMARPRSPSADRRRSGR